MTTVKTELRGWKEIASYLEVSERTAQYWTRDLGMPVHRFPGFKGRVFANPEMLDNWKVSGFKLPVAGDTSRVITITVSESVYRLLASKKPTVEDAVIEAISRYLEPGQKPTSRFEWWGLGQKQSDA